MFYMYIYSWNKLKVCGNLELSRSIGIIFPTTFAHLVSLHHILVILAILQTFSVLLYLLWWSVISDLDVTMAKNSYNLLKVQMMFSIIRQSKCFLYWSIVDLQCVSFWCTAKWFSCTCIHIFFFIFFSIMVYYRVLNIVPCAIL